MVAVPPPSRINPLLLLGIPRNVSVQVPLTFNVSNSIAALTAAWRSPGFTRSLPLHCWWRWSGGMFGGLGSQPDARAGNRGRLAAWLPSLPGEGLKIRRHDTGEAWWSPASCMQPGLVTVVSGHQKNEASGALPRRPRRA
jgi:hypothetical protein